MKISIIVPCYNEEKIIFNTYQEIKQEIGKITEDYEIIFADDGSKDFTKDILDEIAKKDRKVQVISWFPNRGIGYAYRQLYKKSSGDVVVEMDADLSTKPSVLKDLLDEIGSADVVIASKYAGIKGKIPLSRKIPSRMFYLISRILFGIKVKDIGSGFVAFRKRVIKNIELESDGFEIYLEIIVKAKRKGFAMKEIPTGYVHRAKESKLSLLRHGPDTLFKTFLLWLELRNR